MTANTPELRWALIARVDVDRFQEEATAAWRRLFGAPPALRTERSDAGDALLLGSEPGLTGMLDPWALAIHGALRVRIVVLDLSTRPPLTYAVDGGAVRRLPESRALELARGLGLLETVERGRSREVLVMQSATVEGLLDVLGVTELPPTLRVRRVSGGLAAWSVAPRGGVGVFAGELSLAGPCYWLLWGPPPREFSCTIVRDGEDVGCFEIPGPGPKRILSLDAILGGSTPEAICHALGLDDFVSRNPVA